MVTPPNASPWGWCAPSLPVLDCPAGLAPDAAQDWPALDELLGLCRRPCPPGCVRSVLRAAGQAASTALSEHATTPGQRPCSRDAGIHPRPQLASGLTVSRVITRKIAVAARVLAPGHLGALVRAGGPAGPRRQACRQTWPPWPAPAGPAPSRSQE